LKKYHHTETSPLPDFDYLLEDKILNPESTIGSFFTQILSKKIRNLLIEPKKINNNL